MSTGGDGRHDGVRGDGHDDLRARLARAAEAVPDPGDPVARVRGAVARRRQRRTQVRLASASAAAAAVLVAAVVLAPGQLTTDAAPPASPPSARPDDVAGVLLSPDGFPGLELGSEPDLSDLDQTQLRPTGSGCVAIDTRLSSLEQLHPDGMTGTGLTVWLRDGVVVSLLAIALPDRVEVPGDVPRTWVGPTLRSPVATALEVPGARLVKDRPLGAVGPEINDVVIDAGAGAELVLSDVPLVEGTPSPGRITALVLRTEAGRDCRLLPGEDFLVAGQGLPDGPPEVALDAGGPGDLRLGGSVSRAEADGLVVRAPDDVGDPFDGRGCTRFTGTGASEGLDLWADGDTVVAVGTVDGSQFRVTADPAIASGAPFEEVRSRATAVRTTPGPVLGEAVDVSVGPGVRVRAGGNPVEVPATATGVFVRGADVVTRAILYGGDAPLGSLCVS